MSNILQNIFSVKNIGIHKVFSLLGIKIKFKSKKLLKYNLDKNRNTYKKKISVVIPVYNIKPEFIQEAIDSVLNQTHKNIELIIVNDGSTDNETLDFLKTIDTSKIKLVNQENKGAAIARLTGFRYSTGDYIGFLDADDWLDNNYYETLVNLCEENFADIACGTLCRVEKDNQFDFDKFDNVVESDFVDKMKFVTNGSISSKIFKRSLFSLLKFHIEKRYWEDNPILVEAFLKSKNVAFTNTVRYYYRENLKSTCLAPSKLKKRQIDGLYILNEIYKMVKDEKKLYKQIAIDTFAFLRQSETYSNKQEYLKNAKKILNKNLFEYFKTGIFYNPLEKIFSVKNSNDKIHKIITILGVRLKFKSQKLLIKQKFQDLEFKIENLYRKQKELSEVLNTIYNNGVDSNG